MILFLKSSNVISNLLLIGDTKPVIHRDTEKEIPLRGGASGQSSQIARQPTITHPMNYEEPQHSGQIGQEHKSKPSCGCTDCLNGAKCSVQ